MKNRKKVTYFFDSEDGGYRFGKGHPMKPQRVVMTQSLVLHYGLHHHMDIYKPVPATDTDLCKFHSADYIHFLKHITPDPKFQESFERDLEEFGVGGECPAFKGLYRYCQSYAGASIGGAQRLNHGVSQIVINWAGGMHHGKKAQASGFCFVNDIVLAILELLKYNQRVLYVDIDVHHGDGVEEAFLLTNRVMTVSFHKHDGDFFPGTGSLKQIGKGPGKYYSVNAPLKDGIDDATYESLFKVVMSNVMSQFQPEAIVFQSGADSLCGDKIGVFNLSIAAHARCLSFMQSFDLPMLVLGGGGYTVKNVARCWAFETGVLAGSPNSVQDDLPATEFLEIYSPDFRLESEDHPDEMPNENDASYLLQLQNEIISNLRHVGPTGIAFHERPPDAPTSTETVSQPNRKEG
ncbi:hypothetical protein BSKO_13167 [Bryopsis sp. KO-2023]|nr:hypothetical protein BSKO_13167 [Bryopsis sp. KO-2023]